MPDKLMKQIILLLLIACNSCVAQQAPPSQAVDQLVRSFINGEFELAQDKRAQYCAFNKGGILKLGSEFTPDSSDPVVYLFMENDSLVVVKNYAVSDVTLDSDHAEVFVNYDVVFTKKDATKKLEKSVKNETVTYKLIKLNNEWKIIDPPLPRVSYHHLISFYRDKLDKIQKIIDSGKASDAQKKTFERLKSDYEKLTDI